MKIQKIHRDTFEDIEILKETLRYAKMYIYHRLAGWRVGGTKPIRLENISLFLGAYPPKAGGLAGWRD